ncbi:MAG: hypothetical protein LBT40_11095 [Deltaproteobacteria bacterium]|jgi:hypothetical protein|nr:hypothetical protein [Deltaproteobacteria bacterium]
MVVKGLRHPEPERYQVRFEKGAFETYKSYAQWADDMVAAGMFSLFGDYARRIPEHAKRATTLLHALKFGANLEHDRIGYKALQVALHYTETCSCLRWQMYRAYGADSRDRAPSDLVWEYISSFSEGVTLEQLGINYDGQLREPATRASSRMPLPS